MSLPVWIVVYVLFAAFYIWFLLLGGTVWFVVGLFCAEARFL